MNRGFCNSCHALVPMSRVEREGKVFLVKSCPKCGATETLVSSSAARCRSKRELDPGFACAPCGALNCPECTHHRAPTFAFVDTTNRCNQGCPMCVDGVPAYGFAFDPPMSYFEKIFAHLATLSPRPTVCLFGGEPTVRDDICDIVALARAHGLYVRLLTNGLRLADADFCRRVVDSRAHLLFSYDGDNPETYRRLRGSAAILTRKQKAIENLRTSRKPRLSYVTCLAWGLNAPELPRILDFYHSQRDILHGVYLMPLVQTWDPADFGLTPQRMTTEDVEAMLQDAFPGQSVQFISLGLASHFLTIARYLGRQALPYYGIHPNCESFYLLVSDGAKYVPIEHYLRKPLPDFVGRDLMALERRLEAREKRWETSALGRALGTLGLKKFALRWLARTAIARLVVRNVRIGRLFKGKGLGKLGHAFMAFLEVLARRKSSGIRRRHMSFQQPLPVVILPLEDDPILETERLERCASVHVYYNPATDAIKYVPVCAWRLFNKDIVRDLKQAYEAQAAATPAPADSPRADAVGRAT